MFYTTQQSLGCIELGAINTTWMSPSSIELGNLVIKLTQLDGHYVNITSTNIKQWREENDKLSIPIPK